MGVSYHVDFTPWNRKIRKLERMPDRSTKEKLDSVLASAFAAAVAATHIETGSLKASAKKRSSVNRMRRRWTGTIQFGGVSKGINNPVDYAIYEKARGGEHNFIAPALAHKAAFRAVVRNAW